MPIFFIRRKNIIILVFLIFLTLTLYLASRASLLYNILFLNSDDIFMKDTVYNSGNFFRDINDKQFFSNNMATNNSSLNLHLLNSRYIFSKLTIKNIKVGDKSLKGDITVKGTLVKDELGKIVGFSGKLLSKNILLGSKAIGDVRMSFKVTNEELEVGQLMLGDNYLLKGKMALLDPFYTNFQIDIIRADIKNIANPTEKNSDILQGVMNGVFHIKGPLANLSSKGILESRNGKLGFIEYESMSIRLEGIGPVLRILDSNVRQGNSKFAIKGYIDLRDIFKGELIDGLRIESDIKTIVWNQWKINRKGVDELSMTKQLSDTICVGFKTMAREPVTSYFDRDNPEEINLEYRIGGENLNMRLRENEEYLLFQHKVEF